MNDQTLCCVPATPGATDPDVVVTADELAAVAKALGHPIRVRIVQMLLARDACVCGEIVSELPVSQATVSQHLKVLKGAGLVRGEIDGPRVCYCADRTALERHVGSLRALIGAHSNDELEAVR
jgi:ArsR family transcriptional regulator, arsenate/arsenite/antimonite-responsive transcriptional repressor